MSNIVLVMAALFVLTIAGCNQHQSNPKEQADQSPNGRSETNVLQGAGAVGYNGKQVQKSVDRVLDRNDQRNKELENAVNKSDEQ